MIYYFSGTGNSRWVANQIARHISDRSISISDMFKNREMPSEIKNGEILGIVFPSHIGLPPKIVKDFVSKIKIDKNAFVFAVCTCGDEVGYTLKALKKHIHIDSGYSVIMPNNHITMVDSDSDELIEEKINNAKIKILNICENIKTKKREIQCDKGIIPMIKSYIIAPIITFQFNDKKFYSDNSCIGCRLCENICPIQNIKVINGSPVWQNNCIHCMACIHHCPKKSIQYGKSTKNKKRFIMQSDSNT